MSTIRVPTRKVISAHSIEFTTTDEILNGDDGAKFRKYDHDAGNPIIPTRSNTQNMMVGSGNPHDQQSKADYYEPVQYPYAGLLNSTIAVKLLRQNLGGAVTPTQNAVPGTYDQSVAQLAQGAEPMVNNLISANGGRKFLFAQMFVESVEVSQEGSSAPTISAQRLNGGHHEKIADTDIDLADVDARDNYYTFDGKLTRVTFSDGVDSYDFAGEKRLISLAFQALQNVKIQRLMGDTALDATAECKGGFTTTLTIGKQEASLRVRVFMDDTFAEFDSWKAKRKLTSVKAIFKTCETIGSTTHKFEIELKIPIGEFELEGDTQEDDESFGFNIKAIEGDPTTGSLWMLRVRQVGATLDETI